MDTLKFAYALEAEGMDPDQAGVIAHELYALYAHSVLGAKYQAVDYGDFHALRAKALKVREGKQATVDVLRKLNEDMQLEPEKREGERQADEAGRAEQAQADAGVRETNAYLKVRLELHNEQRRLDFVLKNGVPIERDGQFRYHSWAHLGWFRTQREAIDAAVTYPSGGEERT
ncbi:conserved hypothetical protein [Burkholderia sp. 8Y]|uniref:hypothetical protein n=1 Tax=Burkholderia sp. 8Y TaxID=2653133 RepID=UPI0012EF919F|nr:hypothetical protein [Burkholderia sp. 8Y]VXC60416.1 conserved hypothetical protein [Burkholderia sp. 8Y]